MLPVVVTKLGEFFFLYPPRVKRTYKRVGIDEVELIGRAPDLSGLMAIRKACDQIGPVMFSHRDEESEVVVKDFRSKGLTYRILLWEYTPIEMKVREMETGLITDIGRSMFHPRFEFHLASATSAWTKTIPVRSLGLSRWSIVVSVGKTLLSRFFFEDFSAEARLGVGASVGDTVKVLAGYETRLHEIFAGRITRLQQVVKGSLDYTIESKTPDTVPAKPQEIIYLLTSSNIFDLRLLASETGLTRKVTAPGLPRLRPGDQTELLGIHEDLRSRSVYIAEKVFHKLSSEGGFLTRFTFK